MALPVLDDATAADVLFPPGTARGMVPRDYAADPPEMFAPPAAIPLIPRSEWDARIKERRARKVGLRDLWLRGGQKHLDQNGQGYCWAYSTGHAIMAQRAAQGQPNRRLSPHGVACKIKGFRDQGGWCGLSADFARKVGYPDVGAWPEQSMSRAHDTPATWENAAANRITGDWVDLAASHFYYQNLTFDQTVSALLQNHPCPLDFNWWGHSVCGMDVEVVEAGSYGIVILNSWQGWGDQGFAVLRGDRATPNSALALYEVTAS
jgi:hypothetical protein